MESDDEPMFPWVPHYDKINSVWKLREHEIQLAPRGENGHDRYSDWWEDYRERMYEAWVIDQKINMKKVLTRN